MLLGVISLPAHFCSAEMTKYQQTPQAISTFENTRPYAF